MTQDTARWPFREFIMFYSNDWMLIPYVVKTGSLCTIEDIVVQDAFGQRTRIRPAGAGEATDWHRWNMFSLHRRNPQANTTADNRLFIPPTVMKLQEGQPVEEVMWVRDEMANMVWAIENTIPDGQGGARDGFDAATELSRYLESQFQGTSNTVPVPNEARIKYQLGNTVPENWVPFVPVRIGGTNSREIQLQRAAMPRFLNGQFAGRIRPRTDLLRHNFDGVTWSPYYVHEEEVPRSGSVVRQTWQRTRWYDGAIITWLGRRKENGRGQAGSGLEFDRIVNKE